MLKFLRKYNKILLAVGGTVLMIAFLLPDATRRLSGDPMQRAVAVLDGKKITQTDLRQAELELNLLKSLNLTERDLILSGLLRVKKGDKTPEAEHWLMLCREAEAGGFIGGPADGQKFLRLAADQLAQLQIQQYEQMGQQITPEQRIEVSKALQGEMVRRRVAMTGGQKTDEFVDSTLAKASGVWRMFEEYLSSAQLSSRESEEMARRYFDEVKADYAIIPAQLTIALAPEPTEEQIVQQFQKYRDVAPGKGDHGFGYLQPAAITLEWIQLKRKAIEDSVKVDPVEARIYWQKNAARFDADWNTARPKVEAEMKSQAVDTAMADAERIVKAEVIKGERVLTEDGRFKKLPPDWEAQQPNFDSIVHLLFDKLREQRGVTNQPAVGIHRTEWITRAGMTLFPGLNSSSMSVGQQKVSFDTLAFSVREIDEKCPYGIQIGVTAGPTRDAAGNLYYFRISAARGQRPAESLDLVRGEVVNDLKKLSAFDALSAKAPELRQQAAENFEKAASSAGGNVVKDISVRLDGMRTSTGTPASADINNATARTAIMDRGETLDPTLPIEDIPAIDRTLAIPLPETLSVALVQITSVEPISLEQYRRILDAMVVQEVGRQWLNGSRWPFSADAMLARHSYERVRTGGGDEKPATTVVPTKKNSDDAS